MLQRCWLLLACNLFDWLDAAYKNTMYIQQAQKYSIALPLKVLQSTLTIVLEVLRPGLGSTSNA